MTITLGFIKNIFVRDIIYWLNGYFLCVKIWTLETDGAMLVCKWHTCRIMDPHQILPQCIPPTRAASEYDE